MAVQFQDTCKKCKKNKVIVTRREPFPICFDCQKNELSGEITDPEMKKLFNLPEEFYRKSMFLRNIKIGYLRYKRLTDKQIDAFHKAVERIKNSDDKVPELTEDVF